MISTAQPILIGAKQLCQWPLHCSYTYHKQLICMNYSRTCQINGLVDLNTLDWMTELLFGILGYIFLAIYPSCLHDEIHLGSITGQGQSALLNVIHAE